MVYWYWDDKLLVEKEMGGLYKVKFFLYAKGLKRN